MLRIIGFALGYLTERMEYLEKNGFFDYLFSLGVSGIEFTFGKKEGIYSFNPSEKIKNKLRSFEYAAIHAPFHLADEPEADVIVQLEAISRIYLEISAKNVIIHPDALPSLEILEKYNFKISSENLKRKTGFSLENLKEVFNKYPNLGFCLDTSHAYSWSQNETTNLLSAFGNKISQIHLSARINEKDHEPLFLADKAFLRSIEGIKKTTVPIIIEERFEKIDKNKMENEIKFIKEFFKE